MVRGIIFRHIVVRLKNFHPFLVRKLKKFGKHCSTVYHFLSLFVVLNKTIDNIWTQSYKTSFGVITPFFGINYATFLCTNISVEINNKINAKKCFFIVIPTAQNRFIGFKMSFYLITPMPKFWRWHSLFYRIGSCSFISNRYHFQI